MFGLSYSDMVENFHYHVMTIFVNASCLHLHGLMITLQTSLGFINFTDMVLRCAHPASCAFTHF